VADSYFILIGILNMSHGVKGSLGVRILLLACCLLGIAMPALAANNDHMGISVHFTPGLDQPEVAFPILRDLGVGWIRDEVEWSAMEQTPGVYSMPEPWRRWIKLAHENNLKVILILNCNHPHPAYKEPWNVDAYVRWAAWMAKEYGDYVDCFEILNEPGGFRFGKMNGGGTWSGVEADGKLSVWITKYVDLLNQSAKAIKAVRPDKKVIGLGSGPNINFRQLALGIAPEVDGITDHPYSYKLVPELIPWASTPEILKRDGIATADVKGTWASNIRMYREQSAKYKGPKEIWLTEWGYPTAHQPEHGLFAGFTLDAQAKYAQRRFMEGLGLGVNVSIYYDLGSGRDIHDSESNFGLIDADNKPKPAYHAVKRLAQAMTPYKAAAWGSVKAFPLSDRSDTSPVNWDGAQLFAPGMIVTYQFANDQGDQALAIWSSERANGELNPRAANLEITTGKKVDQATVLDLMTGQRTAVSFTQSGQNITIQKFVVPDYPVLLTLTGSATASATDSTMVDARLFSNNRKWTFHAGNEFPGAKGGFRLGSVVGRDIGIMTYDFSGGGAYIGAITEVNLTQKLSEMRLDIRTKIPATVSLRLVDSSGQTHQISMPYTQKDDWQTLNFDIANGSKGHFGGANDGHIHYPVKQLWLILERTEPAGTVEFSNLTVK